MSEESQYSEHPGGWIQWFCTLPQHIFLCEVDEDFILDSFNLVGLKENFNYFTEALEMILSPEPPDSLDLQDERFLEVYQEAADLYGMLHARFIETTKGLAIMREHFLMGRFGNCPRVFCEKQNLLPIGLCETLKTGRIKVYCPRCEEIYVPRKSHADFDGAYVSKSFPQLLLMTYPDIMPVNTIKIDSQLNKKFEPTLYGFKIYKKTGSKYKDTPEKPLQQQQSEESNPLSITTKFQLPIQSQQVEKYTPQNDQSQGLADKENQQGSVSQSNHKKKKRKAKN